MEKTVNELKAIEKVSIPDYFNKYILGLRKGLQILSDIKTFTICPFHEDTDPSFHYWKQKNAFHCFGCGVAGDVVKIHQLTRKKYYSENLSREESAISLLKLFGYEDLIELNAERVNVFERCRKDLTDLNKYKVSKTKMTLSSYKNLNDSIKNSRSSLKVKKNSYAELDMRLTLVLSELVENN